MSNDPDNWTDPTGTAGLPTAVIGGLVGGVSAALVTAMTGEMSFGGLATAATVGAVGGFVGGLLDPSVGVSAGLGGVVFSPVLGLPALATKLILQRSCTKYDHDLSWILVYCLLGTMMPLTYLLENMIFKRIVRKNLSLWAWFNGCGQDFVDAFERSRGKRSTEY